MAKPKVQVAKATEQAVAEPGYQPTPQQSSRTNLQEKETRSYKTTVTAPKPTSTPAKVEGSELPQIMPAKISAPSTAAATRLAALAATANMQQSIKSQSLENFVDRNINREEVKIAQEQAAIFFNPTLFKVASANVSAKTAAQPVQPIMIVSDSSSSTKKRRKDLSVDDTKENSARKSKAIKEEKKLSAEESHAKLTRKRIWKDPGSTTSKVAIERLLDDGRWEIVNLGLIDDEIKEQPKIKKDKELS